MIVEADIRPAPAADNGEAGRLLTSIGIVNLFLAAKTLNPKTPKPP